MRRLASSSVLFSVVAIAACSASHNDNAHTTATTIVTPPPTQVLSVVSRPAWLATMLSGAAADAKPKLTILSPRPNQTFETPTVNVQLSWNGALSTYKFTSDAADGRTIAVLTTGDHVHIVLDNLPYEDCSDLSKPLALHNLKAGKHLLRAFVARPWHESYKNNDAFQAVVFNVSGASEDRKNANEPVVDPTKPLLTYNTPKGEYNKDVDPNKLIVTHNRPADKADETDPLMIDFWLANAKLKGDGGEYRIRYFIDDDDPRFIDKWEPVWLRGWTPGTHTVRLELLGADQWPVKNGGYNITTREIKIIR